MYNYYVQEKLMELENESTARRRWHPRPGEPPAFAAVMRAAGGVLKRLAKWLDSGAGAPERGQPERRTA